MEPKNFSVAISSVCRRLVAGSGKPHGYALPNGVIVVYSNSTTENNMATIVFAKAMFPELVIVSHDGNNFVTGS